MVQKKAPTVSYLWKSLFNRAPQLSVLTRLQLPAFEVKYLYPALSILLLEKPSIL